MKRTYLSVAIVLLLLMTIAASASAQVTGGVTGTVVDVQGGVIPGATVTLTSASKSTTLGTTVTNERGVFAFPNVPPDTYTVTVEMPSFKTLKKSGFEISSGPVTSIGMLTIEIGGTSEVVTVSGETPLVQTVSGEKSFTVNNQQMASLPILGRDFGSLLQLTPGVQVSTDTLTTVQVLGGAGQTTFMVDGAVNMDPGINRQSMKVSVDSVSEVKAVTSSYQAEYGRSAGMQVNVVTKSGTNRLRGGRLLRGAELQLELEQQDQHPQWRREAGRRREGLRRLVRRPDRQARRQQQAVLLLQPGIQPAHEGRLGRQLPHAQHAGAAGRLLADAGQQRQPVSVHQGPALVGPCSAANTAGCFKDGGVLGTHPGEPAVPDGPEHPEVVSGTEPADDTGRGVQLSDHGARNQSATATRPSSSSTTSQLSNLRVSARYSMYQQPTLDFPQNIPGFTDVTVNNIGIYGQMYNANWTVKPTTFVEGNYSRNTHAQSGCSVPGGSPTFCGSQGGLAVAAKSNRDNNGMGALPYIFPNAFNIDPSYWAYPGPQLRGPAVVGRHDGPHGADVCVGQPRHQFAAEHRVAAVHPDPDHQHRERESDEGRKGTTR